MDHAIRRSRDGMTFLDYHRTCSSKLYGAKSSALGH